MLAGMLANQAADAGEGVVLPDEAHRVGISSRADEGNIAGDVDMGRAVCDAGHRREGGDAASGMDVAEIIIPEGRKAVKDDAGRLMPDGAVRRVGNTPRRVLQGVKVVLGCVAVQDLIYDLAHLRQPDAAGNAFPAALGQTQTQKGSGQLHRAVA